MERWHEEYKKRYAELKAQGKSFFPYTVFKDAAVALLVLGVLSFLAAHFGAELEDLADPTDTTYNPRPEWYFLFMFQALKAFPGKYEAVGAVLMPVLGVGLLMLLPFLDRGPERRPRKRPFWTALGLSAISGWGYLTWAGYNSPLTNPSVERDPLVRAGQRVYRDLNCAYCHRLGGKGGSMGPALDEVAGGETAEWLEKHFRDPKSVSPRSQMPKLNLLDDEVKGLVAYMKTLGGGEAFSPEAPKLFAENCASCHKVGKEGGDVGPDLSLIGSARDKGYIKKYLMDPAKLNAGSNMPGFQGQLTDLQAEDLARFLSSLGK